MTKTDTGTTILFTAGGLLLASMFFLIPFSAHASEETARLGGGNALSRAMNGQSQGILNSNLASDLLSHLTLASARGGRPEETPPENANSNSGGNSSVDQHDGASGQDGDGAGAAAGNGANNGGATAGNGGDGGDGGNSSPGGLVRAGNVVSNATALNMINVNIVRISLR